MPGRAMMRAYDVIRKKRGGGELSSEEVGFLIEGYTSGEVPDSQMAAFLMAVYFQGMTARETSDLTMAMARSGRVLNLSDIPGVKVDKHSTGGVGDKTTLVLAPLLAAAGLPVVKMSGRSLGHTGGTLDKLESIPGFSTALDPDQMVSQVRRVGIAIAGQTADLVPADKKIYALRDITATVDCIPLIAASVMSKKIATGGDAIVLDVKAGSGAFMKTVPEAVELAQTMVEIGKRTGRRTAAVVTDMEQPLGRAVGNALEVREAIETLQGNGPEDLVTLCKTLGGTALVLADKARTLDEGEGLIQALIDNGSGLEKLRELIEAQGGNSRVVDDVSILPVAPIVVPVESPTSGWVTRLDAFQVAQTTMVLGAGRSRPGASPDLSVGIELRAKTGDSVAPGSILADIHARDARSAESAADLLREAYAFGAQSPTPCALVHQIVGLEDTVTGGQ